VLFSEDVCATSVELFYHMAKEKSIGDERGRTRNWNFILYPESAPENWREVISDTHIEWVCSPVHDRDLNPDGEPKKAHHHVTLLWPGPKTYDQVKELTDQLNAPRPMPCQSVKGSIRYMTHKDNPEKVQYDWADIKCYNGADIDKLCAATATERMAIQLEMVDFIRQRRITEFADLVDYARAEGLDDWFNVAMNFSTLSLNHYITSQRNRARAEAMLIDPVSGEVIA